MRRTDFAQCLEAYLRVYLPGQAGLSEYNHGIPRHIHPDAALH